MISGVAEWAAHSVNCCTGCSHGCLYCYAREMAVRRRFVPTSADWTAERVRWADVRKRRGALGGTVMFPTTHDVTPAILEPCTQVLVNLLGAGNRVLVVSKPHLDCIEHICDRLEKIDRSRLLFRFTIGAVSPKVLSFWEPGAPGFDERIEALALARRRGFETSVSAEPLLEPERVGALFDTVRPHVTHSIWIGKANQVRRRAGWALRPDDPEIGRIEAGQTPEKVREVYELLRGWPQVRWKESYKSVLGLPLADRAGLDE